MREALEVTLLLVGIVPAIWFWSRWSVVRRPSVLVPPTIWLQAEIGMLERMLAALPPDHVIERAGLEHRRCEALEALARESR